MKLKICVILPFVVDSNYVINPQIGILMNLANYDHEIDCICLSKNHNNNLVGLNNINVINIDYFEMSHNNYGVGYFIEYSYNKLYKFFKAYKIILSKNEKYDFIFARNSILDAILALIVKKSRSLVLFEISNPLDQEKIDHTIENKKYLVFWQIIDDIRKYIMKKLISWSDLVLITTRYFLPEMKEYNFPISKFFPYPNGVDKNILCLKMTQQNNINKSHPRNTSFVYIGTLAKARDMKFIICAFEDVIKSNPHINLHIFGDGTDKPNLETYVKNKKLEDNIYFYGKIPQKDLFKHISTMDVGLSVIPPYSFYTVSSPIKTLEYLALGIPIIANMEILEHKEIGNGCKCGVFINYKEEELKDAIVYCDKNKEVLKDYSINGKKWINNNRTYDILSKKLEARLFQLIEKHK